MTHSEWTTLYKSDAFEYANQNMTFDEDLLDSLEENKRMERIYVWKNPGITYSFKQSCPIHLMGLDHAIRLTGGGIVFHSPGDIVFSMASSTNDPKYPKKPTEKLMTVSQRIVAAMAAAGVQLDSSMPLTEKDLTYCQTYPTPFEIAINQTKICGLTIRQFKSKWLIQGIIHTQKTDPIFYDHIHPSHRITQQLNTDAILTRFTHSIIDQ
jgi:lipoate-protein ligase A